MIVLEIFSHHSSFGIKIHSLYFISRGTKFSNTSKNAFIVFASIHKTLGNIRQDKQVTEEMADDNKDQESATTQRQSEEGGRLNTLFIKSPLGILTIVNFVS